MHKRFRAKALVLCLLAGLTSPSLCASVKDRYVGYAQDINTGRYLYAELHDHHYVEGCWRKGTVNYVDASGQLLGKKTLDFSHDLFVPMMSFEILNTGYRDQIVNVSAKTMTLRRVRDGVSTLHTVPRKPQQAGDAGFHQYILANMAALKAGTVVKLNFVVAGQGDQYQFRIRPIKRYREAGEERIRLKVEPDSLLRLLVAPLWLDYSIAKQKLLRYEGVSNLYDANNKPWQVRINFTETPPADLPAALARATKAYVSADMPEVSMARNCAIFSTSIAG